MRYVVVAMWVVLGVLGALSGSVAGNAGNGLMAPSVCLSPLVFLFVALTPAETLVSQLTNRLGSSDK